MPSISSIGGADINLIYFDLETQRSLEEVGGKANVRKLGMSVAVTYSTATNSFHRYTEKRVRALVDELRSAELIVGFNVVEFDYEVLRGYGEFPFERLPTLDLMDHLAHRLGFRVSLDSVATATLRVGKTSDGLQAIRWYRQGQLDKILSYCQQDVDITRRVHEYGQQFKMVYYWDKQYQRQMVAVNW
ncbi:MAG: putative 3'-5' exonuclease related to the exonuclease domain of PolB [Chloroflexi bacterium ADurb.Bin180]|nr:MAG: putative 3'-5' exonuclease related to the exonuclease domain of PolB [Chloroflexi bacterium ADurb.Bin180]